MTTWELIAEKAKDLAPEKQWRVLGFIEALQEPRTEPRKSPAGLFKDLNVDLDEEGLSRARREMWDDFPREP
jgi:hypothetical protein